MEIEIINGDLLKADVDYIVQQCNCLTIRGAGLSEAIRIKFDSDPYNQRRTMNNRNLAIEEDRSEPGTFEIDFVNPKSSYQELGIVHLFSQYRPGPTNSYYFNNYPESDPPETKAQRLIWFKSCLRNFAEYLNEDPDEKIIGFPFHIGCGLAGGNWKDYFQCIQEFSSTLENKTVQIYKL